MRAETVGIDLAKQVFQIHERIKKVNHQTFETTGTLVQARIVKIRSDYDVSLHGRDISFYTHDIPIFETKDGRIIDDNFRYYADIEFFGFDEPFDGIALNTIYCLEYPKIENFVFDTSNHNHENIFNEIKKWIRAHIIESTKLADAASSLIETAWGYWFDQYDIRNECLDTLEGVLCEYGFDGAEIIYVENNDFAGGLFVEVDVFREVPCNIKSNGEIVFNGDENLEFGDICDFRDEECRFVVIFREDN